MTRTATETTPLLVALPQLAGGPFEAAARSAVHKVLAVLTDDDRATAAELVDRIRVLPQDLPAAPPQVLQALVRRRVVRLDYLDREGTATERTVEPIALLTGRSWYLFGWRRLREGMRGFRLESIRQVAVLDESTPDRGIDVSLISPGTERSSMCPRSRICRCRARSES